MALKLPWKYKSPVAGQNGGSWGGINNLVVTGSFESSHPLMFLFLLLQHGPGMPQSFSPLPISFLFFHSSCLLLSIRLTAYLRPPLQWRWWCSGARVHVQDISGSSGSPPCPGNQGDGEFVRPRWSVPLFRLAHVWHQRCHHFIFLTHSSSSSSSSPHSCLLSLRIWSVWGQAGSAASSSSFVFLTDLYFSTVVLFLLITAFPPPRCFTPPQFSILLIDHWFNSRLLSLFGREQLFLSFCWWKTDSALWWTPWESERASWSPPQTLKTLPDSRRKVGTTHVPPAGGCAVSDPAERSEWKVKVQITTSWFQFQL